MMFDPFSMMGPPMLPRPQADPNQKSVILEITEDQVILKYGTRDQEYPDILGVFHCEFPAEWDGFITVEGIQGRIEVDSTRKATQLGFDDENQMSLGYFLVPGRYPKREQVEVIIKYLSPESRQDFMHMLKEGPVKETATTWFGVLPFEGIKTEYPYEFPSLISTSLWERYSAMCDCHGLPPSMRFAAEWLEGVRVACPDLNTIVVMLESILLGQMSQAFGDIDKELLKTDDPAVQAAREMLRKAKEGRLGEDNPDGSDDPSG